MLGASIATIAGYMVYTGLIWYQSRSYLSWDISFKVVTTVVIFTLASIVIVDKVIVAHGALLNLFLSTALFIVLYGIGISVWNRRNLDSVKNLFARGE
jgi:O-antigen/teichoic acid export membrane protein